MAAGVGDGEAPPRQLLSVLYWKALEEAASAGEAKAGLLALVADYRRSYPSAMRVITDNLDELVAHLRFPLAHRKRTRSTNLLERTFVEVRRRTKVIGRFPRRDLGAVLDLGRGELSSRGWRGVEMTPRTVAEIERIRRSADEAGGGDRRVGSAHRGATPERFSPEIWMPWGSAPPLSAFTRRRRPPPHQSEKPFEGRNPSGGR